MMLMTGVGVLAAAVPVPPGSGAHPRPPAAPVAGSYIFHDEFDGPAGSAPDPVEVGGGESPGADQRPDVLGATREHRAVPRRPPQRVPRRQVQPRPPCRERRPHLLQRQNSKPLAGRRRPYLGSPDQARLPDRRQLARLLAGQRGPGRNRRHRVVRQRQLAVGAPPSTRKQTAANGRPTTSRWTAVGTRGDANGMRPVSASGKTTSTARNHISMFRRTRCRIGRSTAPATPFSRSSISRSPVPVAVIPDRAPIRRRCSSTGYGSGRHETATPLSRPTYSHGLTTWTCERRFTPSPQSGQ